VLGYRLDDWGFESQKGLAIFLFTAASRLAFIIIQYSLSRTEGNHKKYESR
jgi:hypothetical protein